MPVKINNNKEEAATGAAMFAAVSGELVDSVYDISNIMNRDEYDYE